MSTATQADVDLTWQEDALCRQVDGDLFYPEAGGTSEPAKKVCQGCPVRTECLEYALSAGEQFGVWGGMSEQERKRHVKEQAARKVAA